MRTERKKYTRSTFYVLPMLHFPLSVYSESFINCFIQDENYPDFNEHIFILLECDFILEKQDSYLALCASEHYNTEYTMGDYHMMVFDVPDQYYQDYKTFLTSKYSQFTEKYKEQIKRTWPSPPTQDYSLTISALYPDSEKSLVHRVALEDKIYVDRTKEQLPEGYEIISRINPKNETFCLSDYYEMIV